MKHYRFAFGTACFLSFLLCLYPLIGSSADIMIFPVPFPNSLILKGNNLFWTDTGDFPVKKYSFSTNQITVLARKVGIPVTFQIHDEYIYWIDGRSGWSPSGSCNGITTLWNLNKSTMDGKSTTTIAVGDNCAWGTSDMVLTNTAIYWVTSRSSPNTYTIMKVPHDGSASEVIVTTQTIITGMTSDSSYLYFVECQFPDSGFVKRVSLDGGTPIVLYDSGSRTLGGAITIHGSELYFSDTGWPASYRILKLPVSGGKETALASVDGIQKPRRIFNNGKNVFWIDKSSLYAVSTDGGNHTTLSSVSEEPSDVIAIDDLVFWSESTGPAPGEVGTIRSIPEHGGAVNTVIQAKDGIFDLRYHNGKIYWTEGRALLGGESGRIVRANLNGEEINPIISGVGKDSCPIAADSVNVYIGDGFKLRKVCTTGGTVETIVDSYDEIADLKTDGENVYWIEAVFSTVFKVSVEGGPKSLLSGTLLGPAGSVRVVDDYVYFMANFDRIHRVPVTGGPVETIVRDLPFLNDFVVDRNHVFVSENDTGVIKRIPVGGGPGETLLKRSPFASPRMLSLFDRFLYWIDQRDVGELPIDGGLPNLLVSGTVQSSPFFPGCVAVDAARYVWTEVAAASIVISIKPCSDDFDDDGDVDGIDLSYFATLHFEEDDLRDLAFQLGRNDCVE